MVEVKEQITLDQFFEHSSKLEIKYGRVTNTELVPKSEKLIKLTVDFGNGDIRTVVTNMKNELPDPFYLTGQGSFFVTNLKPGKLMGIESQAMIMPLKFNESLIWPNSMSGAQLL